MKAEYKDFLDRVKGAKNIRIYGAGKFARTLYSLFVRKGIEVESFVVADLKKNPSELFQKPVIELSNLGTQEHYTIVVGLEKKELTKEVLNTLLEKNIQNIIMVPLGIVNDIYCNFVIDEDSVETFCRALKRERSVITYIADSDGNIVTRYLQSRQVPVEAVCSEWPELFLSKQIPIVSFEQLANVDKDSAIVLTMGGPDWQRGFITRLRQKGFEKIILLSEEIKATIKSNYSKVIWEENGANFQVIDTVNVEKNHYLIQRKDEAGIYRWRIPMRYQHSYEEEHLEAIRNDELFKEYKKLYFNCNYLSYEEVPLCEADSTDLNIQVFLSKCHKDKKIEQFSLPEWITPIQVGKALTDIQIAEVCDNTGDNISTKNTDYSEGTALYWIWKNTQGQDYVGLFHYRRQLAMGKDSLHKLMQYDALLTVPTYIPMSTKEFFCTNFILEYDWNLMMAYIKEYDESYYETALKHEKAHSYFPCNIFIMRRKYFDEMCAFIFGVLEKVDGYYENIHMVRKDRYLGYLVENLLSIYTMHHAASRKIAYTDMKYYYPIEESTV